MDTDEFLKVQQAEIERVLKENADLRAKLERAREGLKFISKGGKTDQFKPFQAVEQIMEIARATLEEIKE